jgi:electron transfer flavoprotein beta subunit
MKIVVPVKSVATLDEELRLDAGATEVDPDDVEWSLNEWDPYSVEAALRLAEHSGGEVVIVSVGGEEAEEGILTCLANGASRGLRIWDDALARADALLVARVLAAAVEREQPDLVLCGVQSSDAVNSATGIALAGHLGLPHVAVVRSFELEASERTMKIERELEGGTIELLRIGLPALLTVQTGINEPRYATLRAIKQAAQKPLETLTPAQLGLDDAALTAASGARVRRLYHPESGRNRAEMLDGSAADMAERIARIVRERIVA